MAACDAARRTDILVENIFIYNEQVSKVILQKAVSLYWHPLRRRMESSDLDPSNKLFLGPTGLSPQSGISIGSAVFAQLTRVSNTQTHRPRYVQHFSNRPHPMHCVRAMRSKMTCGPQKHCSVLLRRNIHILCYYSLLFYRSSVQHNCAERGINSNYSFCLSVMRWTDRTHHSGSRRFS